MAHLFISYAREDKRFAEVLSARLKASGHMAFLDSTIPGGTHWESEIAQALSKSDWVVVLLSARSVASDFVREEVRRARDMGKLLIPIRVGFEKELPLALGAWLNPLQHLEWSSHENDDELIRQILSRLQSTLGESALPSAGTPVPASDPPLQRVGENLEGTTIRPEPASTAGAHEVAPAGARPEFTIRAVVVGLLVAVFVGLMYPYVVLKIGFGPNISVVSAFFGFVAVSLIGRLVAPRGSRYEYNIVQTAGTAAGQMGFMVIVLAAFDLLASRPELGVNVQLTTWQIFGWLTLAGGLGVLLAVPLRKHYIDEEQLTFADGTAAGETLVILDTDYKTAKRGVWALTIGGVLSFVHTLLSQAWRVFPESLFFGKWGEKLHVGTSWSLLSIASGMIVGLRVTLSMGLGMVLSWYVAPPILSSQGWIADQAFRPNLNWVMWPAVGLMISGGLTALVLKWKLIVKTFKDLKVTSLSSTDFPIRWVVIGSVTVAIGLVVMQKISLGLPVWLSVAAILVSLPLMVVGTRVLGETNWAPISAFGNLVQLVFAALAPGNATVNMLTSGMSGTVAANGEHLMQDYKAGKIIGSNNKYLTYMQLLALPFGAMAVAIIYPILRWQNGIGPDRYGLNPEMAGKVLSQGLVAPASVRWAGFAEILSQGVQKLQEQRPYALHAFLAALAVGMVLTLLEAKTKSVWVPSATSMGLGMLIEAHYVLAMVVGGFIAWVWNKRNAKEAAELNIPLSSGGIVGEAIAVLTITIVTLFTQSSTSPGGFFSGQPEHALVSPYLWGAVFVGATAALLATAHRRSASGVSLSGGGH